MSNLVDILDATTELVASIDALLQSDTVQVLPGVAAELGIEDLFNDGVTALANLLRSLNDELGRLEDVAAQFDGAILGLLEPLVDALGRMLGAGGDGLQQYGLGDAAGALGDAGTYVEYAADVFGVASNLVIDTASFAALRAEVEQLADTVEALRTETAEEGEAA